MFFKPVPSISTDELEKIITEKLQIMDVRETHEFQGSHILGAKNIPLGKIASYTPSGITYVICQSGMRSKKATRYLMKQGYDVVNVRGGMSSWAGTKKGGKV